MKQTLLRTSPIRMKQELSKVATALLFAVPVNGVAPDSARIDKAFTDTEARRARLRDIGAAFRRGNKAEVDQAAHEYAQQCACDTCVACVGSGEVNGQSCVSMNKNQLIIGTARAALSLAFVEVAVSAQRQQMGRGS